MTHEPFTMSVRLPSNTSSDVRMRVALALVEAALDRLMADGQRAFEQSLVDNEAPVEDLADLLIWQHEEALAWRSRTLEDMRAKFVAEFTADDRGLDASGV
jgi:hypothetical protein